MSAGIAATTANGEWSLDGIRLGSRIDRVIATRGKPQRTTGNIYYWDNAAGGTLQVETGRHNEVILVHVAAGDHEIKAVSLPGAAPHSTAALGQSRRVNYLAPRGAVVLKEDLCTELGLAPGKPCETYKLRGGAILVVDFADNGGTVDGVLSEILLAAPGYFSSPHP